MTTVTVGVNRTVSTIDQICNAMDHDLALYLLDEVGLDVKIAERELYPDIVAHRVAIERGETIEADVVPNDTTRAMLAAMLITAILARSNGGRYAEYIETGKK